MFVMTEHITKKGEPKIVAKLGYPVTGLACVDRVYTDLCIIDVTDDGLKVIEMVQDLAFEQLQSLTGAVLVDATKS